MDDTVIVIWVWATVGLVAYILRQRYVIYKLRKKLDAIADRAIAAPAVPAPAALVTRHAPDPEIERLRERLQVLERITIERESSLSSEIEQLRAR